MNEYTVRVKDKQQGIIHKASQMAKNQKTANKLFIRYLQRAFRHRNFEVL